MDATHYPQYPQSVVEDGEEPQHEKTPVLKKVKEKVKKVKDKISKKRHGHGGEEHREHGDGDGDDSGEDEGYEEEEEEKKEVDPEVHGAPMYENEALRNLGRGKISLGKAMAMTEVEEDTTVAKAGGDELGEFPILSSFQAMSVSELKSGQHPGEKPQPGQSAQPDKGVSVKEYIAEKLRPGDEDRALLEVITGTIEKKKEEKGSRDPESGGGGKGMVEKIKGAVSSWLGTGSVPEKGTHAAASQTDTNLGGEGNRGRIPPGT